MTEFHLVQGLVPGSTLSSGEALYLSSEPHSIVPKFSLICWGDGIKGCAWSCGAETTPGGGTGASG